MAGLALLASVVRAAPPVPGEKVCGVYGSILSFDSRKVLDAAVAAEPVFLSDKHKRMMSGTGDSVALHARELKHAGFNTVFLELYPIHGMEWWAVPAARGLVKDALVNAHAAGMRVHLGLSLFNGGFCDNPGRYPGASRTVQCDGTRPSWVCFHDDALWAAYQRNCVELAKLGREVPGALEGIFLDPEAYGPECYLCFCDNCVRKYDGWAGRGMPVGLVKPDAWLMAQGLWKEYAGAWHDHEVRRHAEALRDAVHAVDPELQLSSLLWDYPVAVGIGDARQGYFRQLAIGLGTKDRPSWTMPEHTYYSDADDLGRIVRQVYADIDAMGAAGRVKVVPGVRVIRQSAGTLAARGRVVRDSDAVGYWLYELSDLNGKAPIDFEGALVDSPEKYWEALRGMNASVRSAAVGR